MTPDTTRPLLEAAPLVALAPTWRVHVVAESPSTHAAAAEDARAGRSRAGDVLVAEHQTAGRGRLDRTWTTPPRAALTFSALVGPAEAGLPEQDWPWLPLLLGLAVVDGVERAGGPACALKWPNDVLDVEERKVGGLLAERVQGPDGPLAVLSAGLNVSTTAEELPVETAGSLALAGWERPDRTRLLAGVLTALAERLETWSDDDVTSGADRLRAEYVSRCTTVGREVRVQLPGDRSLTGTAVLVDRDGSLVVETPEGRQRVSAGDVVHVRPAG